MILAQALVNDLLKQIIWRGVIAVMKNARCDLNMYDGKIVPLVLTGL